MRRFILYLSLIIWVLSLASCLDSDYKPDLPITENFFDWKTTNEIDVEIPVSALQGDLNRYYRTVNIYSSPSYNSKYLMISGSALPSSPFVCTISIPTNLSEIFIEIVSPDGSTERYFQSVTPPASKSEMASVDARARSAPSINVPSWDIPSSFDEEITEDITDRYDVEYSKKYLVPAGYDISSGNNLPLHNMRNSWGNDMAEFYVAGKLTVDDIQPYFCTIIILDGGELVVNGAFDATALLTHQQHMILYVMEGGKVTFNRGMDVRSYKTIVNKGEIVIGSDKSISLNSGSFSQDNGIYFYNTGIIHGSISGIEDGETIYTRDINISASNFSYILNDGTIYADKYSINEGQRVYNPYVQINYPNGKIFANEFTYTGTLGQWNKSAYLDNYGYISSDELYFYNVVATNSGYIGVGLDDGNMGNNGDLRLSFSQLTLTNGSLIESDVIEMGNSKVAMNPGSIIFTNKLGKSNGVHSSNYEINNEDDGYSLIIVTENLQSLRRTSSEINGEIEIWHQALGSPGNDMSQYEGRYDSSVIWEKEYINRVVNIPESPFNKGYGVLVPPEPEDKDGDGVLADMDIDDNDPTIAYRSYYPNEASFGTFLFEDLWPHTGDYDLNDVVCDYHIEWTQNARNEVVYLDYYWKLRAMGATYKIAMAFQIDDMPVAAVRTVEHSHTIPTNIPMAISNGMESGQNHPVIPFFNDAEELWGSGNDTLINTIPERGLFPATTHYCRVHFTTPVAMQEVMLGKINTFLIATGFEHPNRNWEIHLPGFKRTNLASTVLNNRSGLSQNDPYISNTGMMWGLMLPESIQYTKEAVFFEDVYLKYRGWYISKGVNNTDWYQAKSGYINPSGLYSHN